MENNNLNNPNNSNNSEPVAVVNRGVVTPIPNSKPVENKPIDSKPIANNSPIINPEGEKPQNPIIDPVQVPAQDNNTPGSTDVEVISIQDESGNTTDYNLDAEGNALDKDGKIVYTSDELKTFQTETDNNDEPNLIEAVSKLSGLEIPDSYTDDVKGVSKLLVDVKTQSYAEGVSKGANDFLNSNPDIADMYKHKMRFGNLDNYTKSINYTDCTITDETGKVELESIIRNSLTLSKNDPSTIDRFIKMANDDDTLRVDAISHLERLRQHQIDEDRSYNDKLAAREADAEKEFKNYYGVTINGNTIVDANIPDSIYDKIVKKGTVGDFDIPVAGIVINKDGVKQRITRQDIFNYIQKPVAQDEAGNLYTQAQLDEQARLENKDNWIIQAIRNLSGNDLNSLADNLISKKMINKAKLTIKSSSKGSNVNSKEGTYLSTEELKKGGFKVVSRR